MTPNMTFDLGMWPWTLTKWPNEHMKISLFVLDFYFSNETNSTFLAYLTSLPQMTFDLGMWPVTSLTDEGSHTASMTHIWLKSIKACRRYGQMLTHFYWQTKFNIHQHLHTHPHMHTEIVFTYSLPERFSFRWDKNRSRENKRCASSMVS